MLKNSDDGRKVAGLIELGILKVPRAVAPRGAVALAYRRPSPLKIPGAAIPSARPMSEECGWVKCSSGGAKVRFITINERRIYGTCKSTHRWSGQPRYGYASYTAAHPDEVRIVGVAEPREIYRQRIIDEYDITTENAFADWREAAAGEKFADAVFVATQDAMHSEPAATFAANG